MSETKYTPEQDKYILDNAGKVSFSNMGVSLGKTKHQIRGRYLYLKEVMVNQVVRSSSEPDEGEHKIEVHEKGDFKTVTSDDVNIRTLDQLLKYCEVDLKVWRVESHSVIQYQSFAKTRSVKVGKKEWRKQLTRVPLFRVKATLKRISPDEVGNEILRKALINDMNKYSPRRFAPVRHKVDSENPVMVEINVADHHFAKLCWAPETGASYDLKIAARMFMDAMQDFAGQIRGMPVERILLPVGNDILHTDTITNETTGGTRQDTDSRWPKMYLTAKRCLTDTIDIMREIAPVQVVIVPGNHDRQRSFFLGDTLQSFYRHDSSVVVDNGPAKRKFFRYGVNLIGFTHLDTEKASDLPLQMAITQKKDFAETKFWEWHVGHIHQRRSTEYRPLETHQGVQIRVFPSLCAPDSWHFDHCFNLAPRSSDALIWRKHSGPGGILTHNPIIEPSK